MLFHPDIPENMGFVSFYFIFLKNPFIHNEKKDETYGFILGI
jgi:hypothetical protein